MNDDVQVARQVDCRASSFNPSTSMDKEPSLEYIAGFFDGEGSIGLYPNGQRTFYLRTQMT